MKPISQKWIRRRSERRGAERVEHFARFRIRHALGRLPLCDSALVQRGWAEDGPERPLARALMPMGRMGQSGLAQNGL
eukprot:gene15164-biopygen9659